MSMQTFSVSKYITKSGSASDLQKTLNDYAEQDYELVNIFMFMSANDGLRFHIVMKR